MLRIAAAEDLTALTRLRRAATGESTEDAVGWLQQVAGLENVLLLEKPGAPPALMLAAVPVHYAHRKGIWFTGLAADKGVPADKLLPKLLEGALRAFAEKGCDFAVMTPDTAADAARNRGHLALRLIGSRLECLIDRCNDQILQHVDVVRINNVRLDFNALERGSAGYSRGNHTAACRAGGFHLRDLLLRLEHALLHLLCLLHHRLHVHAAAEAAETLTLCHNKCPP